MGPEEEQLLGLLRQMECHPRDWQTGRAAFTDLESLERHGKLFYGDELLDWQGAVARLQDLGWVSLEGEVLRLAAVARSRAERLRKAHLARGFGVLQVRCEGSAAYREFCRQVFGPGLLPFSLTDREQLGLLKRLVGRRTPPRVLDLGCGVGTLTEFLQGATGGSFTGVDLAPEAIQRARERASELPPGARSKLSYRQVDLDSWQPPPGAFDVILGIDVLHFLDDLPTTLRRLLRALPDHGRMLFLGSELAAGPKDDSLPAQGHLLRSLDGLPVTWDTWDFSSSEEELWRRQQLAAIQLRERFEAEGAGDLARMLAREAKRSLVWVEEGRVRRYLYRVRPAPRGESPPR